LDAHTIKQAGRSMRASVIETFDRVPEYAELTA